MNFQVQILVFQLQFHFQISKTFVFDLAPYKSQFSTAIVNLLTDLQRLRKRGPAASTRPAETIVTATRESSRSRLDPPGRKGGIEAGVVPAGHTGNKERTLQTSSCRDEGGGVGGAVTGHPPAFVSQAMDDGECEVAEEQEMTDSRADRQGCVRTRAPTHARARVRALQDAR